MFHAAQLEDYLSATGAARGALVYMTAGFVRWVKGYSERRRRWIMRVLNHQFHSDR
jgi:hypothetical protein